MSWQFNPPPGWPRQPAGWQPPPGWQPDPSWPPAPPGWQFWLPAPGSTDAPYPGNWSAPAISPYPSGPTAPASPTMPPGPPAFGGPIPAPPPAGAPAPHPRWLHRWSAFLATGLTLMLVGCLAGGGVALVVDRDEAASPTPPPTTPADHPSTSAAPDPTVAALVPGVERSGQGPSIVPLALPLDAVHIITVTFTGSGFFDAALVDDEGEFVGSIGSGVHEFEATVPLDLDRVFGDTPSAVDIASAEGSWTLLVQDLSEAPLWPEQTAGSGQMVLRVDPEAVRKPVTLSATHDGEMNFIVWAYGEDGFGDGLLFNEIGDFSGKADAPLTDATIALEITADGEWTLKPPRSRR